MSTTGQTYYMAAREELVARLKLREQILNYFVVAAGAIFGVAISDVNGMGRTVVLIIPLIGLGTAILITAHTMVITNIARHTYSLNKAINKCRKLSLTKSIMDTLSKTEVDVELEKKVEEVYKATKMAPWDWSETYKQTGMWSSWIRVLGNYLIFIPPVFLALTLGVSQVSVLDNQKNDLLLKQEESHRDVITNIKSAVKSGSDKELSILLKKQGEQPEKLNELNEKIRIHNTLLYSSIGASLLMSMFIILGQYHRQKWIKEIPTDDE